MPASHGSLGEESYVLNASGAYRADSGGAGNAQMMLLLDQTAMLAHSRKR